MKFFLDTNAFMALTGLARPLPSTTQSILSDPAHQLFLSMVSPWEMQIKITLNKLILGKPLKEMIQLELDRGTFTLLPITLTHIDRLSTLPLLHRDPFDRLLIAQALTDNLTLITADRKIQQYPVDCLWH